MWDLGHTVYFVSRFPRGSGYNLEIATDAIHENCLVIFMNLVCNCNSTLCSNIRADRNGTINVFSANRPQRALFRVNFLHCQHFPKNHCQDECVARNLAENHGSAHFVWGFWD